jgi:hypothetical protein
MAILRILVSFLQILALSIILYFFLAFAVDSLLGILRSSDSYALPLDLRYRGQVAAMLLSVTLA